MDTKNSYRQPDPTPRTADGPVRASTHRTPRLARWKASIIAIIVAVLVLTLAGVHGTAEAADVLISNLGLTNFGAANDYKLSVNDFAQSFTTGPNVTGYLLESISIDFGAGGSRTHDPVYVYLHEDNGNGRPNHNNGGQVATLTKNGVNFEGPVAGVNKYTVWKARCYPRPPHGGGCISEASSVHLDPNTTYWVYIWAGEEATTARLETAFGTPDTAAVGWSLSNAALAKPQGTTYSNYATLGVSLKLSVEGTTNPEVLVSINDVTVTEGIELTADFVVSLSQATSGVVTVDFATRVDTATVATGSDYADFDGTLTFQPGETEKTVSVTVNDDARNEGNETFDVILTNVTGATIDDNTGVGTIVNADPLTVSISDATATEGDDATIDFTVSLNRATNQRIPVNVLFSSGTADFSDVTDPNVQVVFEPGETEKTYSFGVVDDGVNEPSETFEVVLQTTVSTTRLIVGSPGTGTILNTETLTASFENVPQDHDGSTAFTFNVAFNNDISITPTAMRDHAFTVTNGDVSAASLVNGSSTRWLITVDPDGDQAITITLPGNRACGTQGAICSDEDNPVQLSNSPSATVAAPPEGDPLTASFSNVPDSHNGSDFSIDLTFSEGPDVGWRDVKNALSVSRGSINRVNRETQGSNVGWRIKVRPAGTGELTIRLPATTNCSSSGAICTTDDRRLSNSLSVTIAETSAVVETTPSISIAGGSGNEGDDSIAFTVTLDEAASGTVTVDYSTSDGSADAGDDYTAKSGTLSFSAGETSKTISIAIKDDIENESDETFTVTLSNASGADLGTTSATGTIRNRHVATLTATFSNVPSTHDGSSEFTFDLSFSENVRAGYARIRDHAFTISGISTIASAVRKTQGSNQTWTITVEPDGNGAVSITLPETTDCNAASAICTYDDRKLSHTNVATITGPQ